MNHEHVPSTDPSTANAIKRESAYVEDNLVMIASENYASPAILEVQGSLLTNKHAGGYPGNRTLPGCEFVDEIEQLAIKRAKRLWGADHVNVQPYSGSIANMIVYLAVLKPGDRILSLEYANGGHRTHGHPSHATGQLYNIDHYHIDSETGRIDYDQLAEKANTFDPDLIVSGYSAYPRDIDWAQINAVAESVEAYHLADIAHSIGLIATGHHSSPVGIADFVTGSTDKTIRSGRGGIVMCDHEYAELIDATTYPGLQGGPIMPTIAGKAVGFQEALRDEFTAYIDQVVKNAQTLAETLTANGLDLVTGGTDTHLVVVDLSKSHPHVSGQTAEEALKEAGIVVNKQAVPGESHRSGSYSGLRIGTPAITTRGLGTNATKRTARNIVRVINNIDNDEVREAVRTETKELCRDHPVYE